MKSKSVFGKFGVVAVLAVGALAASSASAGTAITTLPVEAIVTNVCTVTTAQMSFNYSGAEVNSTGQVAVTCSGPAAANIQLNNGSNFNGLSMQMASGADRLAYSVGSATAAAGTALAGWPAAGVAAASVAGGNTTVHGRILGGQNVPAGTYTDSIQVTVTY